MRILKNCKATGIDGVAGAMIDYGMFHMNIKLKVGCWMQ